MRHLVASAAPLAARRPPPNLFSSDTMRLFLSRRHLSHTLALGLLVGLSACGGGGGDSNFGNKDPQGWNSVTALQISDVSVGTGATAVAGKAVTITYSGWIFDARQQANHGQQFASNQSFSFVPGANQAIAGVDQGVLGMKVGGVRTLTIPASMAYGANGQGAIPPNAALVFTVQLASAG